MKLGAVMIVLWTAVGGLLGLGFGYLAHAIQDAAWDPGTCILVGIAVTSITRTQLLWEQIERVRQTVVHRERVRDAWPTNYIWPPSAAPFTDQAEQSKPGPLPLEDFT